LEWRLLEWGLFKKFHLLVAIYKNIVILTTNSYFPDEEKNYFVQTGRRAAKITKVELKSHHLWYVLGNQGKG
jgi:hypothetical protein